MNLIKDLEEMLKETNLTVQQKAIIQNVLFYLEQEVEKENEEIKVSVDIKEKTY